MVKEKTDMERFNGEVINALLQVFYPAALRENHIAPIANPQVNINEFDIEKDFEFTALIATKPDVEVNDYKTAIKKVLEEKNKAVKASNAEKLKKGEELEHSHAHLSADDVINGLVSVTKIDLPSIVIEDETNRMMAKLVDQAQAVGISIDQYLATHNKTVDDLRMDYQNIATRNLTAEFALAELIKKEKVEVSDAEVDEMIKAPGDEKLSEEMNSPGQRMYIRSILLKNKLITNIVNEIEGDPHAEEAKVEKKEEKETK
jgi:FKBP-type peptidyl-prolyl cis-trans isomerase (trigger factor)